MLAALAVSAQAGYLRDLKEEAAPKNRVVKTFQFPATLLVSSDTLPGSWILPHACYVGGSMLSESERARKRERASIFLKFCLLCRRWAREG